MVDEPLSLSDAQVAALARPGESWDQACERAYRLYSCVIEFRPCPDCNPTGLDGFGGWIDGRVRVCMTCMACEPAERSIDFGSVDRAHERQVPSDMASVTHQTDAMLACLYCKETPADLGCYCSSCYGRVFHEDESPLVLINPADPWNEFNLEADRAIADDELHTVLVPRMLAVRTLPIKVRLRTLRPYKLIMRIRFGRV